MGINDIIVWILMICMVLGGLDRAIGNKFGLGEKFEEGFNAMGPLALSMVGVYALSPVLAKILGPIVTPVYKLFGADPAMFAGTLLANDMGGWPLAQAMTDNPDAQRLSGLIATLANNLAMFEIFKNMDRRGKILNAAFAVSAAFALGDHLGFTAGVAPDMIAPMIAGKLVAGITAVALAFLLFAKTNPPATSDDDVVAEAEAGE